MGNDEITPEQAKQFEIINEAARRVHTVLCNYATVLARSQRDGIVSPADSHALINGGVSGVAVLVARMALTRNPDATEDARSPVEFYADMVREQFLLTYHQVQQADAMAALQQGAPVS